MGLLQTLSLCHGMCTPVLLTVCQVSHGPESRIILPIQQYNWLRSVPGGRVWPLEADHTQSSRGAILKCTETEEFSRKWAAFTPAGPNVALASTETAKDWPLLSPKRPQTPPEMCLEGGCGGGIFLHWPTDPLTNNAKSGWDRSTHEKAHHGFTTK